MIGGSCWSGIRVSCGVGRFYQRPRVHSDFRAFSDHCRRGPSHAARPHPAFSSLSIIPRFRHPRPQIHLLACHDPMTNQRFTHRDQTSGLSTHTTAQTLQLNQLSSKHNRRNSRVMTSANSH